MDSAFLKSQHDAGKKYGDYVATGTPQQQSDWGAMYGRVELTPSQQQLIGSFTRRINVVAMSGIWCGDCVQQGPIFARIAEANAGAIDLRWVDRDEHEDLQQQVMINGGKRVPVLIFCAEDYELVSWYGDKPLSRYRALAKQHLGASCPLPGAAVPADDLGQMVADWVAQFERVHLLLRLSGRLRQIHGD